MVSKEYPRIGEKIYHAELPNGLHIYVDRRPEFQKSYAFFATNYGGMDMKFRLDGQWRDTPAGVAHFLEHKMFDTEDGPPGSGGQRGFPQRFHQLGPHRLLF